MPHEPSYPSADDSFEKAIAQELRRLLSRGGVNDWSIQDLRHISHAARCMSPKPTDPERIKDVLTAAIAQYGDADRRQALSYWFALVHDPELAKIRAYQISAALELAYERIGDGQALSTFRTHEIKRLCAFLARHICEAYWAASHSDS